MSSSVRQDPQSFLNEQSKELQKRIRALEESSPGDVIAETIQLGDPTIVDVDTGSITIAGGFFADGTVLEGARVRDASNQSISNNSWNTVNFDTEDFDTHHIHDPSSNNQRLTCQQNGIYHILALVIFDTDGNGFRAISIQKNSTTYISYQSRTAPGATRNEYLLTSTLFQMVVGDYFTVDVYQNSGSSLNILADGYMAPLFQMYRLG